MGIDVFDNYECEGQMSIFDYYDIDLPEEVVAVSDVFARARKQMTITELKAFTYALTKIRWNEKNNSNIIFLDKKQLAEAIGLKSDPNHLSQDIKRSLEKLIEHSSIEISVEDKGFWESGRLITNIRMLKDMVRITFYDEYMPLFEGLENNYITLWSRDIFGMRSERSVTFYEELRESTNRQIRQYMAKTNSSAYPDSFQAGYGIKPLKEMFGIPKEGKGSYMRKDGHFDRRAFEQRVIEPLCEDLRKSQMITLIAQPDGKFYEKVKQGSKVLGYRFYWNFSKNPRVASAEVLDSVKYKLEKNPEIEKVAIDLIKGKPKKKKNSFNNFSQRDYDFDELEKALWGNK